MKNFLLLILVSLTTTLAAQPIVNCMKDGRSFVFDQQNVRLRITPYGDYMMRVQAVRTGEEFFPDDHYEMVETHEWPGMFVLSQKKSFYRLASGNKQGATITVDRASGRISFFNEADKKPILTEKGGTTWRNDTIRCSFIYDQHEHFTGLGHSYYGRADRIDLQGQRISRNYGTEHGQQAPLLVPFFLSSKGYGIFLNSTFPNQFNFGQNGTYDFAIAGDGRMDYFVIMGPEFAKIIDRYTQLTGRPRLPLKAFFGLALSDKGNDHTTSDPSDENWWKKKITEHRKAGFPLDHIVNDNRWRAKGGQRCVSCFDWDSVRYPDPSEYAQWVKSNGLITTLDFNRCIAVQSEGWKPSYNLPQNEGIDFNTSAPDFTKQEVRDWFWNIMWNKSLNPALHYPGDALWIDEFDEMGKAPVTMKFENGTTWKEMRNYWFFLISKALVQQGWDKGFGGTKRPFVWVRGMTAGAQRYATLWSGDIKTNYDEMKMQVRGLQLAGLSGFPYWAHDAGGFHDGALKTGPDDTMYKQWSMAFGSFTPFWKPHGVGKSRWPLDRPEDVQQNAMLYSKLRYQLMPYIYSVAHQANETGLPMARPMVMAYQHDPLAWKNDLQYLWGDAFLVAPNCSDSTAVRVWLPQGTWYNFWNDEKISGGKTINHVSPIGQLPLFVKAGSIIPMSNYAQSTAFLRADSLTLHVYVGNSGNFTLYEDDGVTEAYKFKNEKRVTRITFDQKMFTLNINPAEGQYQQAVGERTYRIDFHGLAQPFNLTFNGTPLKMAASEAEASKNYGAFWNSESKIYSIFLAKTPVTRHIGITRAVK